MTLISIGEAKRSGAITEGADTEGTRREAGPNSQQCGRARPSRQTRRLHWPQYLAVLGGASDTAHKRREWSREGRGVRVYLFRSWGAARQVMDDLIQLRNTWNGGQASNV